MSMNMKKIFERPTLPDYSQEELDEIFMAVLAKDIPKGKLFKSPLKNNEIQSVGCEGDRKKGLTNV
jgi:hypothetical protein